MWIKGIRQTVFINKQGLNKVYIDFGDIDQNLFLITVKIGDKDYIKDLGVEEKAEVAVYLPAPDYEYDITVEVTKFGEYVDILKYTMKPVKKWTIAFIASSHEDLGFCEYANRLGEGCADFLDRAMDIMDKDSGYRYVIEHYWWLKAYEDYRDEKALKRVQKYLDSGNLELATPHSGVHVHWHGYEQLARSTYYTRRMARKKWNTEPVTALYADISAMSWAAVSPYADSGMKYFVNLYNKWRNNDYDESMPRFFWWTAPNRKDRLLCWIQREYNPRKLWHTINDVARHYREGEFVYTGKEKKIADVINEMIEALGDVPYDLLPISYYDDREPPTSTLLAVCNGLNGEWEYPKFEMGLPAKCLEYIEKSAGDKLPVFHGDMSDQWADFCAIAPEWVANKREAEALLPVAETLSIIESIKNGALYPKQRFEEAMWRMCEFDEHCWATSIKEPPFMHKYNLALMKEQSALVAKRNVSEVISRTVSPVNGADYISVWNVIPSRRKTALRLPGGQGLENIICQKLYDGSMLTEPVELPAYGVKGFKLGKSAQSDADLAKISSGTINTGIYAIKYDEYTGKIESIYDNELKAELLDTDSRDRLGDFIYINAEPMQGEGGTYSYAKPRGYRIENGPLAVSVIMAAYEENLCAEVTVAVTFYKNERNIDFNLTFNNATGLMGEFSDRYKKNIFIAFPFKMENFKFYTELAGGVVDESSQRLLVGPKDFVVPQNWVAAENSRYGIALFTKEMPLFHLGGINLNKFLNEPNHKYAHVYLHAACNRANSLNFYTPERCRGEYNLSILPYHGRWQDTVPMWSAEKLYPPIIGGAEEKIEESSYFELSSNHIKMTALKKSEDDNSAIIAKFIETAGKPGKASFTLPFVPKTAVYTNIVEEETGIHADVDGTTVSFEIEPFSYVTLKITAENLNIMDEQDNQQEIRNIFTINRENRATVLSWEKRDYRKIKEFKIFADGEYIMTVENEPFAVQFCEIPSTEYAQFTVEPVYK